MNGSRAAAQGEYETGLLLAQARGHKAFIDLRLILGQSDGEVIQTLAGEPHAVAKVRAGGEAALRLLKLVEASAGFRMEWVAPDRFEIAKAYFRKHRDHGYSFTDCTSFVVMRELRLREALTADHHFAEAGFLGLLLVA